jgi:glycosyltransferase involved in cell wall biosynthesis
MPLFSVIIPTKNRSYLVRYAIQSILNQTCRDLEVVVVDNDDNEDTQAVISSFDDPRLRCVRTGGLSMHDNWDRGFREARGEYITLITDRVVLRPHTLERVGQAFASGDHKIVSWLRDHIQDPKPGETFYMRLRWKRAGVPEVVSSHDIISRFLSRSFLETTLIIPTGTHSCCHRSVVERLLQGPAGRVSLAVAPDYTFAFQQLAFYDHVLMLNEYLGLTSMREGTGISIITNNQVGKDFVQRLGGPEQSYTHVPIKRLFIQNSLYNDYLRVQELVGGNLLNHPLTPFTYFVVCYSYLLQMGVTTDTCAELDAWEAALSQQPADVQAEVRQALLPIRRRWQLVDLRERLFYGKLRQLAIPLKKGRVSPVFPDILAALEWEEQQRKERD